jgi:GntR family transcriptional regulator, transcriptional repressor for pyruvate dehydrogenase complex
MAKKKQVLSMNPDVPLNDNSIHPILPVRVPEQIVKQIQGLISEGNLKPGDRLPPEREFAQRFQVSRNSVRAAIRTLETLGIVETRQGEGTFIRENIMNSLTDNISNVLAARRKSITDVIIARKIFEPGIAYQAARQATTEQISELEEVLHRYEEKVTRDEPILEEDQRFHYLLARMTCNSIVMQIINTLMDTLRESRELFFKYHGNVSLEGHRRIVSALKSKDPEAASQAMLKHIEEVEASYNNLF